MVIDYQGLLPYTYESIATWWSPFINDHYTIMDYGQFFGINICDSYAIHDGYDG